VRILHDRVFRRLCQARDLIHERCSELIEKGTFGFGVFETADVRKTYAELKARGVQFVREPQERPYGIEAIMKDDSGNWFSLTQHSGG